MVTRKEQFDAFFDANPQVADIFLRFIDELRNVGVVKIRADEVLHRVRWELLITGGDYDLVDRLKTLYGNRYAMELMTRDATYRGFFDCGSR